VILTLDEIKRHAYYPFRNFRTNDLEFLLLELYWAELFREILSLSPNFAKFGQWTPRTPADRADGNPILNVIDRSSYPLRGLRVIQRFNTEGLPELDLEKLAPVQFTTDAYVPFVPGLTYGATDEDGVTPIEELLISSDISGPCERLNRSFMAQWCVQRVAVPAMQRSLDEYWRIIQRCLVQSSPAV
jgi:hypothetical protein